MTVALPTELGSAACHVGHDSAQPQPDCYGCAAEKLAAKDCDHCDALLAYSELALWLRDVQNARTDQQSVRASIRSSVYHALLVAGSVLVLALVGVRHPAAYVACLFGWLLAQQLMVRLLARLHDRLVAERSSHLRQVLGVSTDAVIGPLTLAAHLREQLTARRTQHVLQFGGMVCAECALGMSIGRIAPADYRPGDCEACGARAQARVRVLP